MWEYLLRRYSCLDRRFNADGDFDDAGEQLGSYGGAPTTTRNFTFIVPATATLGATRMRVMQQEGGSPAQLQWLRVFHFMGCCWRLRD